MSSSGDDAVRRTRATYDDIGPEYQRVNAELPESVVASMDQFEAGLPTGAVVADVGCGPGRDLRALRARGLKALGFDLSLGMLAAATGPATPAGSPVPVVLADMTALPVRAGTLDGIWCAAALLHVPRERTSPTLAGFARALRLGGLLHLSIAEGTREGMEPARYGANQPLWLVERSEAELRAELEAAGFAMSAVSRSLSHRRWLTVLCSKRYRSG